ncbi:MAG: hypothetical protein QXR44_03255 [Thermoproteota archaeon]
MSSIFDKLQHNINILRGKAVAVTPPWAFMNLERRRMEKAGAKFFLKAMKEGDYFYHMTSYPILKEILRSGVIKADRHRRGTVSFTTHPLRYLSAFGGPAYPVNNAYIKIPMKAVPNAFPVVYWLAEFEAEELPPEIKSKLIPIERFEEIFMEYGLAWPAYVYPFIWAYENEWRVLGDFHLPWEDISVGVSNLKQQKYIEETWWYLKDKVFVDKDLERIFARR